MVVKKSTPNDGIYTELGRAPLLIIRQIQMIKFANRIWNLEGKYLVKKASNVQIMDDINGHYNWFSDVIQIMNKNNIKEINVYVQYVSIQYVWKHTVHNRFRLIDSKLKGNCTQNTSCFYSKDKQFSSEN